MTELETLTPTTVVDSRGTMCPGPITDLFRAYRNSKIGDIIELLATDLLPKATCKLGRGAAAMRSSLSNMRRTTSA